MRDKVKQALKKTNRVIDGVVGYHHKLTLQDVEYSFYCALENEDTLTLSDDRVEFYFIKDYNKALKLTEKLEGFDQLEEDQKVKVLTKIIKNNYA
jgi:hypothetical protein